MSDHSGNFEQHHEDSATHAAQQKLSEAVAYLRHHLPHQQQPIRGSVILGSGLGNFVDSLQNVHSIPYSDIPHFPTSTVSGHAGRLVIGDAAPGFPILCMQGRFHYYEGHDPAEIAFPIRVLRQLGAKFLIVTNAAGAINPALEPAKPMLITDHINFMGFNPLRGAHHDNWGARFVDMTTAYDVDLRQIARDVARGMNLTLGEGVYAGVSGPNYETPAEIRMLATLGADAVGMSTVPEVIVARQVGLRVLGISMIANAAAGFNDENLSHADVLAKANEGGAQLRTLMQGVLHTLAAKG